MGKLSYTIVACALLICATALNAQVQHDHSFCTGLHKPGPNEVAPPITFRVPPGTLGNSRSLPVPWSVERIWNGSDLLPFGKKINITIITDLVSDPADLAELQSLAYECRDVLFSAKGYAGRDSLFTISVLYAVRGTDTYRSATGLQDLLTDLETYAPETDYRFLLRNDSTYGGQAYQISPTQGLAYSNKPEAPHVFLHEMGHLLGMETGNVVPCAMDEYSMTGQTQTPEGYNMVNSISNPIVSPWVAAGFQFTGGYGFTGTGKIPDVPTYMFGLYNDAGIVMENYVVRVIQYWMRKDSVDIIASHYPAIDTVRVTGLSQDFAAAATTCVTWAYQWYVDGNLVQSGKDSSFEHIFAQYDHPVRVRLVITDTSERIIDHRTPLSWERNWTVVPDPAAGPVTIIDTATVTVIAASGTGGVPHAIIDWATSVEFENDLFAIEMSPDSLNWEEVATDPTRGNSLEGFSYRKTIQLPCDTRTYLRLTQIDASGGAQVKPLASVQAMCPKVGIQQVSDAGITAYPNPSHGTLFVTGCRPTDEYSIYGLTGQMVQQGQVGTGDLHLLCPPGLYLMKVKGTFLRLVLF